MSEREPRKRHERRHPFARSLFVLVTFTVMAWALVVAVENINLYTISEACRVSTGVGC